MNWIFPRFIGGLGAVSLLLVRLVVGAAFILHGLPKLQRPFGWMGENSEIPGLLQFMAAITEVGGGALLILGALTPLVAVMLAGVMVVAVLFHLGNGDPFVAPGKPNYELALVYLALNVMFFFIGPGKLAIDYAVFGRKRAAE